MWQRYQSRQPLLFYSLCSLITANFHITNSQTILQNCTYLHFLHDLLHLIHRSTITREYLNSISTVIFGRLLEQRKPRYCKLTVLPRCLPTSSSLACGVLKQRNQNRPASLPSCHEKPRRRLRSTSSPLSASASGKSVERSDLSTGAGICWNHPRAK